MHSKLAYDLKFTAGGIRRQVIRCTAARHQCEDCKLLFLPKRYRRRDKHLHGLKSWAMYQHVVHRVSFPHLETMFEDCFGLSAGLEQDLHRIKALMANRYRATWKRILARIVGGGLVHADETHANLRKGKGYVWALTNLEDVVYMYRPNREADFLQELLRDFKGVLVTDFYAGYDSLPCEQQKCLVHLIRDINNDLKGNPYDEEFKTLAGEFGKLLRSIVDTIDRYGLKKRHLHKHKPRSADSSVLWRPASTARSWRRATRNGFSRTRGSCSPSWTTTGCRGTTTTPSTRSRRSPSTAESPTAR